jgi:AraC-like DNA-binding protein
VGGVLEIAEVAWMQIARMTAAGHRLEHRPFHDGAPAIAMSLQVRGTSVIEQEGRRARLVPGCWSVVDSRKPYTLMSPSLSQRLILIIPTGRIEPELELGSLLLRSFSGTVGFARLAFNMAMSVVEELAPINTMRASVLAASVWHLASLALHEGATPEVSWRERSTLVDRLHSYISEHLPDPDLSIAKLARGLSVSKRSLHRAARDVSGSIHNLIWHTRLDRCRGDLLDPSKAHCSIGDIARSWGFKNLTHFSRAFRDRFGISAREVRRFVRQKLAP